MTAKTSTPLPIDPILGDIVRALERTPSLVLAAPPGAGKTTRVPRALLDSKQYAGEIVVLEPRRLAARMAARRVAEELGESLGQTVGYQVRFEEVASARTRIRFVTEGVLTRRLLTDPELRGVSAVLLDEFHERHLHADIALALLRRLQRGARKDLRLVAMSATLDAAPVAAFLECETMHAEGRRFEVAIEYAKAQDDRPLASQIASAVRALASGGLDGDVLVFLPGAAEIRRAREACEKIANEADLLLLPLHGDLSPEEQDRAVKPAARRKVILATNVAESSVTIDGVAAVIDSGLARIAAHAPWSGLPMLRVDKISRASATQRAGRAGRTRAGRCIRLYTKADHDARAEHEVPEIRRLDLTQTVLELRASAAGIESLEWFEAPPPDALTAANELLERLGATSARGEVTALGRRMLKFPLHPRQARLLVEAEARGVTEDAAVIAALIAERDIRQATKTRFDHASTHAAATERSDLIAMLDLFREAEASGLSYDAMRAIGLDAGATLAVERARKQLVRLCAGTREAKADAEKELLACVLAGYPDRVAKRKKSGSRDLALATGGIAELAETSVVRHAEWMVAVDAERRGTGATLVRLASGIEPDWLIDLFAEHVSEASEVTWNASRERAEAVSRMTYEGLALHESIDARGHEPEIARVLSEAAIAKGPRAFATPAGDERSLDRWLARARFAAGVSDVKAPTDDDVRDALREMCEGRASFAELREQSLLDVLKVRIGHAACARIDALAPERIALAAGRHANVEYEEGKPPWAESYLQDFFGMVQTPKIAEGRAMLVLHLWAPNKRAVQVTSDLAGFWERHYPAIRKELARKYPRHSWPEEPRVVVPRYRPREGR